MDITAKSGPLPLTGSQPLREAHALEETGRKFEAAFLAPMLDEMLKTVGPAALGGGHAEEMWRSFLAGAIADEVAESGTTGIAQSVTAQLKAYGG